MRARRCRWSKRRGKRRRARPPKWTAPTSASPLDLASPQQLSLRPCGTTRRQSTHQEISMDTPRESAAPRPMYPLGQRLHIILRRRQKSMHYGLSRRTRRVRLARKSRREAPPASALTRTRRRPRLPPSVCTVVSLTVSSRDLLVVTPRQGKMKAGGTYL